MEPVRSISALGVQCAVCRRPCFTGIYGVVLAYIPAPGGRRFPLVCSHACAGGLGPEYVNIDVSENADMPAEQVDSVVHVGSGRFMARKQFERVPPSYGQGRLL